VDKENYIDATVIEHIKYTADFVIDVLTTCLCQIIPERSFAS
jgi:hypothetical protein